MKDGISQECLEIFRYNSFSSDPVGLKRNLTKSNLQLEKVNSNRIAIQNKDLINPMLFVWISPAIFFYLWKEISRRLKWIAQLQLPKYPTINHNIPFWVQSLETYNSVYHRNYQFSSPLASTTQSRNQLFLHSATHRGGYFPVLCLYDRHSFRAYKQVPRWFEWKSSLHYSWKVNFLSSSLRNCKDYCCQNTPWLNLTKIQSKM